MKKLALLACLVSLVSCGGDSDSGSKQNPRDKFQEALSSLVVGQSSLSVERGSTRTYDFENDSVGFEEINKREFSVVLKIDASKVYSFVEKQDLVTGARYEKVVLTSQSAEELNEVLKLPGTYMKGDNLHVSLSMDWTVPMTRATVKEVIQFQAVVNLAKPLCEVTSNTRSSGEMTKDGRTTPLQVLNTLTVQTCERIFTREELKALDLTSIEFCDETSDEEIYCEANMDMSYLTEDLYL